MTKVEKWCVGIMAAFVATVIGTVIWAINSGNTIEGDEQKRCEAKGGVYIQTGNGGDSLCVNKGDWLIEVYR